MLTKLLAVEVEQAMLLPILVGRHVDQLLGDRREIGFQPVGKVGVDAGVLFLERDRQGQDLTLGQALEGSQAHLGFASRMRDYV